MPPGSLGLELTVARDAVNEMSADAELLAGLVGAVDAIVDGVAWKGPDATDFRKRWRTGLRDRIQQARRELLANAEDLHRWAAAQQVA